jgi:hypothetical protein
MIIRQLHFLQHSSVLMGIARSFLKALEREAISMEVK